MEKKGGGKKKIEGVKKKNKRPQGNNDYINVLFQNPDDCCVPCYAA